ncbi:MAG TPA: hypothetical protein GX505_10005 [Clostridiales bacterium]|nr:hypothetical protein [Clostridiales bacterium]
MELQDAIQQYIDRIPDQREKKAVISLLLNQLPVHMGELTINIPIKSLQMRKDFRKELAGAFCELYSKVTTSKEKAKQRILKFSQYLMDNYSIELSMEDMLVSENMNAYERQIDLLKTLQQGVTKQDLLDHYVVSRKVIEKDLDNLIKGTKILGQHVKIRNYQSEDRKLTYQSTIHPIFLPLNLTEVFYMFLGLKLLSRNYPIESEIYNSLAYRIYAQLSEYAKSKIGPRVREYGFDLPPEDELHKYMGSIDEEKMAKKSKEYSLMHLFKTQEKCTIHLNSGEVIRDCFIKLAGEKFNVVQIFLKRSEPPIREVTPDDIETVYFKYK